VERRNDRDVEGSDEVENVSAIRPAPDSVLVLDRDEVDVAVVDGASRPDVVLRGVEADPVMDLAGIGVELICVMQRNDLEWPSGGSEVPDEGGDSTATRGVGGSERNLGTLPFVMIACFLEGRSRDAVVRPAVGSRTLRPPWVERMS
jgi:hypothetical protein